MTELEATVSTMESSLKTVSENFVSLRKNQLELKQIKEMLSRADGFLTEHRHHLEEEEVEAAASKAEREETSGMEIHVTAGVIDRSRLVILVLLLSYLYLFIILSSPLPSTGPWGSRRCCGECPTVGRSVLAGLQGNL